MNIDFCFYCKETQTKKMRKCGNCKSVYYCSRECQKKDWSFHKGRCKNMKQDKKKNRKAKKTIEEIYAYVIKDFGSSIKEYVGRLNLEDEIVKVSLTEDSTNLTLEGYDRDKFNEETGCADNNINTIICFYDKGGSETMTAFNIFKVC